MHKVSDICSLEPLVYRSIFCEEISVYARLLKISVKSILFFSKNVGIVYCLNIISRSLLLLDF